MINHDGLDIISSDELANVAGGGIGGLLKAAGKGLGKVAGPAYSVFSGYQGSQKYYDDRKHGKSVGRSLWDGAKKTFWF